jgi:hypothetical protein
MARAWPARERNYRYRRNLALHICSKTASLGDLLQGHCRAAALPPHVSLLPSPRHTRLFLYVVQPIPFCSPLSQIKSSLLQPYPRRIFYLFPVHGESAQGAQSWMEWMVQGAGRERHHVNYLFSTRLLSNYRTFYGFAVSFTFS